MGLCQFKDIFGRPNEGVHKARIFGVAAVDLSLTIILAILIGMWRKWSIQKTILFFIGMIIASILIHRIFCVKTALTVRVFD